VAAIAAIKQENHFDQSKLIIGHRLNAAVALDFALPQPAGINSAAISI
jgi:hypothetical protein